MLVLLGIGFLAGAITAISPCVLPVLPILLAGGASGAADALQARVEGNAAAALHRARLPTYGLAPGFNGISLWLNSKPLSLAQLRGKVVLVDFWTYSCVNCLHLDRLAQPLLAGGVPDRQAGARPPRAPRRGRLRRHGERDPAAAGRGGAARRRRRRPDAAAADDARAYLGHARVARYEGTPVVRDRFATYDSTPVGPNELSYAGRWKVETERILAGTGARLRLGLRASDVYLVLGGRGAVTARVGNGAPRTIRVAGDRLYTIRSGARQLVSMLELRFTPGVSAYGFTFG